MKTPYQFKLLAFLIFILIFNTLNAQVNYTPGHIINLKGEKIPGFLKFKRGISNPDFVLFKTSKEGTAVNYSSTKIKGFKADSYHYISAEVTVESSPRKTNMLEENYKLKLSKEHVFLQLLYNDTQKKLYRFTSTSKVNNFFIYKEGAYQLLRYKRYLFMNGSTLLIRENKQYRGQLKEYLSACDLKDSQFKNMDYDQNSIMSIFKKYATCTNSQTVYKKKDIKMRVAFGAIVGASLNTLHFTEGATDFDYLSKANFNTSTTITAGAYIDLARTTTSKWSWNNELLYMSYDNVGHNKDITSTEKYTITDSSLGVSQLKLNSLIRYTFPVAKLHYFINAGISNGFTLSTLNNSKNIKNKYFSEETTTEEIAISKTKKHEQGLLIGAGVKYKKFSFETRFERGNGMSAMSRIESQVNRIHFLCSYQF